MYLLKNKFILLSKIFFGFLLFCLTACDSKPELENTYWETTPVLFGKEIPENNWTIEEISEDPPKGFAYVQLQISNIPAEFEGEKFTLIGGGLDQKGFHGPNATSFQGDGFHFAILEGEDSPNPIRTDAYKKDYTRTVSQGILVFDIYYEPTDINEWGERYPEGSEVALTLMKWNSTDRVMHAHNNVFNWSIANVGSGNSVRMKISIPE